MRTVICSVVALLVVVAAGGCEPSVAEQKRIARDAVRRTLKEVGDSPEFKQMAGWNKTFGNLGVAMAGTSREGIRDEIREKNQSRDRVVRMQYEAAWERMTSQEQEYVRRHNAAFMRKMRGTTGLLDELGIP